MVVIHAPEKCKDYYVSRITRGTNHRITVKLPETKLLDIRHAGDNGFILKMWIPPDSIAHEVIEEIDDKAIIATAENNHEWFANGLSDAKICEYFRRCINNQVCNVVVSALKIPRSIVFNGQVIDDFEKIALMSSRDWKSAAFCSCTLEAQGLYFYPKRFGIRWILREIAFHDGAQEASPDCGNADIDREDIEEFWESEVRDVRKLIRTDMDALYSRIDLLATVKKELLETLEAAKAEEECSSAWEEKLDDLKTRIFKYKSGRL